MRRKREKEEGGEESRMTEENEEEMEKKGNTEIRSEHGHSTSLKKMKRCGGYGRIGNTDEIRARPTHH